MITRWLKLFVAFAFLASCAGMRTDSSRSSDQIKKEVRDNPVPGSSKDEGLKRRILLLPFLDASSDRPEELKKFARDEMVQALYRVGDIVPVDADELKTDVAQTMRLGEYDLKAIAKEAAALGVNAVLEGKIMDFKAYGSADPVGIIRQVRGKFEVQARVRMIATSSGRELLNAVKTVSIEKSDVRIAERLDLNKFLKSNPELLRQLVKEVFSEFVPQVSASLGKVQWEGRVAMVSGDRIFLNVGKISGIQIGDILKVSEEGEEIYDPQSGNYIGRVPGRLKGTLEVVSYFGKDGAIAVVHSGSGFKENDRVEPYSR